MGATSSPDSHRVVDPVLNIFVIPRLPWPSQPVVVAVLLGTLSKLFRRGHRKVLTIDDVYRSYTINSLRTDVTLRLLDPDANGVVANDAIEAYNAFLNFKDVVKTAQR